MCLTCIVFHQSFNLDDHICHCAFYKDVNASRLHNLQFAPSSVCAELLCMFSPFLCKFPLGSPVAFHLPVDGWVKQNRFRCERVCECVCMVNDMDSSPSKDVFMSHGQCFQDKLRIHHDPEQIKSDTEFEWINEWMDVSGWAYLKYI